ncbi:hypothetical protein ASE01_10085 [Nocardioides sp. Root190]|nr:hypothetical protein ASE01_10085 [Nocardioides sp. Root190]
MSHLAAGVVQLGKLGWRLQGQVGPPLRCGISWSMSHLAAGVVQLGKLQVWRRDLTLCLWRSGIS